MNVLLAPDSFKESLCAKKVALAMEAGIKRVKKSIAITIVPMADGGEGTMEALVAATDGVLRTLSVQDPLGRPVNAQYGITGDGRTAIVEWAAASGLSLLEKNELAPAKASSYGTGQLIADALERGLTSFIICLGGSATNDGASGLLTALGFRFLDRHGNTLAPGGLALKNLAMIDRQHAHPLLEKATFQVACDVRNPLLGKNGASAVFGPQKGATPEMVQQLDEALTVYADKLEKTSGKKIRDLPGSGAAGGAAAGLMALLNARLAPGFEIVQEHLGLKRLIKKERFSLILTGEGKLDSQTASGKVVSGMARLGQAYGIPVLALAGSVEEPLDALYRQGLTAAFSIAAKPLALEEAMAKTEPCVRFTTEQVIRAWLGAKGELNDE